jgi:hypothetical protein
MCVICYISLIMLTSQIDHAVADEHVARLIAAIDTLRNDLDVIAAERMTSNGSAQQLTVEQLARQLGVSRSTVYAHWQEWGGYKLGAGTKAPIRFDGRTLQTLRSAAPRRSVSSARDLAPKAPRRRSRRRDLTGDAPRLAKPVIDTLGS